MKSFAKALLMYLQLRYLCNASLTIPRNAVAAIGDRVELNCRTDGDHHVIWSFTSFNTSKEPQIYNGDDITLAFKSRYRIDNRINGQHNLVMDSVDLDHAGKYTCAITAYDNKTVAYLTVLASSPECSASTSSAHGGIKNNGYLLMRCRISLAGFMIPIFTWTKSKSNTEYAIAANTSESVNRSALFNMTSSVITQLTYDDNGVIFKCKIAFRLPSYSEENAPDYEYTWNHTTNVLYGPRNISISRDEGRLVRSADGNPEPDYNWTLVEINTFVKGPILTLDKTMDSAKIRTVECTAVNELGAERKSYSLLNDDAETSQRTDISAGVGGGSFILFLLAIFISCFFSRKTLKENRRTQKDPTHDDPLSSSPLYEINESPSTLMTPETSGPTEDVSDGYCALEDRTTIIHHPAVYCSLQTSSNDDASPPDNVTEMTPVYANIAQYTCSSDYANTAQW